MTTRHLAGALAAGILLLAGCASFADAAGETATTTPGATSPTAGRSGPAPMDDVEPAPTPLPTTETPGAWPALDVAVAAMTAYIDHSVDPAGWYSGMVEWLSPEARVAYARTDNAQIPALLLVGTPTVVSQTDYLATVLVPTDAGTYRVLLSRKDDSSWQIERITPPEQAPGA